MAAYSKMKKRARAEASRPAVSVASSSSSAGPSTAPAPAPSANKVFSTPQLARLNAQLAGLTARPLPELPTKTLVFASACPWDRVAGLPVRLMRRVRDDFLPEVHKTVTSLGMSASEVIVAVGSALSAFPLSTWPQEQSSDPVVLTAWQMHDDILSGRRVPDILVLGDFVGLSAHPLVLEPMLEAMQNSVVVFLHDDGDRAYPASDFLDALKPFWEYLDEALAYAGPGRTTAGSREAVRLQTMSAIYAKHEIMNLQIFSPLAEWARRITIAFLQDLQLQPFSKMEEEFMMSDAERFDRPGRPRLEEIMRKHGSSDYDIGHIYTRSPG